MKNYRERISVFLGCAALRRAAAFGAAASAGDF
jgi:hypothetical protein